MATITITKALVGKEDISFESSGAGETTFSRTKAGGGTQTITKLGPRHLSLEDAGDLISATTVEGALQELALNSGVFLGGKGSDIASSATIVIPSSHLYFDITGTTSITAIIANSIAVAGRLLVLQFDSTLTVKKSSTLRINDDFEAKTGLHLVLVYDGTNWFELARTKDEGIDLHSANLDVMHSEELGEVRLAGTWFLYTKNAIPSLSSDVAPTQLNGFIGGQNS